MKPHNYIGYEKVMHEALVAARGAKVGTHEDKIHALERKLETSKLSHLEIADIHKQLKHLRLR